MSKTLPAFASGEKFLEHLHQVTGKNRHPYKCQWEITCRCNLKCVMCYTDCFNTPEHIARELSFDEIIRIMDDMKNSGVMELVLTGGEPMSRTDFKEIYKHAVTSGFMTTIYTNGTFINEEWIRIFKEFPPTMIEISYHGRTSQTFDAITAISGSHQKVQAAIFLLMKNEIPLRLKTTALDMNYDEILAIKQEVESLNGPLFRLGRDLRPLANGDTSVMSYQLSSERLYALTLQDEDLMKEEDRLEAEQSTRTSGCHEGLIQFHIDAYGQLQLCSSNRRESYDLRKGSFKDGFYEKLPSFPCPYKAGSGVTAASSSCGGCS